MVGTLSAFCAGRHQALVAELTEFETHLPAACAIGTDEPGLRLYALAGRTAGIQIENPRQTSAFHYPRQYGPRSPSFSRAVLKAWEERHHHLYISGTASIVGHASQHVDLMAQLDETLFNLRALLAQANRLTPEPLRPALLKVYCRPNLDSGGVATADRPGARRRSADLVPASRHLPPGTADRNRGSGGWFRFVKSPSGCLLVKSDQPLKPHPVLPSTIRIWPSALLLCADYSTVPPAITIGSTSLLSWGSGSWYRRHALVRAGLRPGMSVLDVAIGTGLVARQALAITQDRRAVVGLDVSAGMLEPSAPPAGYSAGAGANGAIAGRR